MTVALPLPLQVYTFPLPNPKKLKEIPIDVSKYMIVIYYALHMMHMLLMLTGIKVCVYCNATIFKIALVICLFFFIP